MKTTLWMATGIFIVTAIGAQAAGITYNVPDRDAFIKITGRVQVQYHVVDPQDGDTEDDLLMRRMRLTTVASSHPDWAARVQFDFGKGDVSLLDAYMEYSGFDILNVAVGNYCTPFSRESITSSKKQQLVERTLVGNHNYGVTDRQVGVHLYGDLADEHLSWGLSAAKASIDPDNSRVDFDSMATLDQGDDWNKGDMLCGRIEFAPLEPVSYDQGDFEGLPRLALALAGYAWENDGDTLDAMRSNDVDSVTGVEVNAAVRGGGFSVDAGYNRIESELANAGISEGLYTDSETTLEVWAVEGGYMLLPEALEAVVAYEELDADGYHKTWSRTSVGLNYFISRQDIKTQVTYRMGEDVDGKCGNDVDELFIQLQYVF